MHDNKITIKALESNFYFMSTNEILLPVYVKNIFYELYTKYVIFSFILFT